MNQRSLHALTKVYYRSSSCFAMVFPNLGSPLAMLRFPYISSPSCTLRIRSRSVSFPTPPSKTQPIAALISKQVIPYRTRGGTCCPTVSTPKTRSLADSSMTNHISWRISTVSTIPSQARTTTLNLTMVNSHHNRWKTNTVSINTSQTQQHKDRRLVRQ
jgi:hypothetical protein